MTQEKLNNQEEKAERKTQEKKEKIQNIIIEIVKERDLNTTKS